MPLDWKELDVSEWHAPDDWTWTVNDELAHHLWSETAKTREVGWGLEPPMMLEALMGFFGNQSQTDSLNNWYFTRIPEKTYMQQTTWEKIASKIQYDDPNESGTSILMSTEHSPYPFRVQLHGQQYTVNGGMFTYDFAQWQGEEASGFCRIPCPRGLLDEVREQITELPFEETEMQTRAYRDQFADGPPPDGTFYHPHFAPSGDPDTSDYKELFTRAHTLMKRAVRMEDSNG